MEILSISIDLNKIQKSKIIPGKNGAKYYNLTLIVNDDFDKYNNNIQVIEPQTKEQREAKEKREFIGNGRRLYAEKAKENKNEPETQGSASDDDLPF